jgi:two-component system nitrogen regulation response regulator NtrX
MLTNALQDEITAIDVEIRMLVLDDEEKLANSAIANAFRVLGAKQEKLWLWRIELPGVHLRIIGTPVSDRSAARNLLFEPETANRYDLVLLDADWGGEEQLRSEYGRKGYEWVQQMKTAGVFLPYLAIFTNANTLLSSDWMETLRCGAKAIIRKGEPAHLLNLICSVAEVRRQRIIERSLLKGIAEVDPRLVTRSPIMQNCLTTATAYASLISQPILLTGPTGCGKELLARAIHKYSRRSARPFEVVNCAAIPRELAVTELFGSERGAFTGAITRRGAFERAEGGTLFLDEIDLLDIQAQGALLRAVAEGELSTLGSGRLRKVDVRIISATSRNLDKKVEDREFSLDLYGRLQGGVIHLPGLNDRREDIPALVSYFVDDFLRKEERPPASLHFTPDALQVLRNHDWKSQFNIRGLRMAVERSLAEVLPTGRSSIGATEVRLRATQQDYEKQLSGNLDIARLAVLRPRAGNQQAIFDTLIQKFPSWVPVEELQKRVSVSEDGRTEVGDLLSVKVSQLKKRLEANGFTIEGGPEKGYRFTVYEKRAA